MYIFYKSCENGRRTFVVTNNSGESRSKGSKGTYEGKKRVNNNSRSGEKKELGKPYKKDFKSKDGSKNNFNSNSNTNGNANKPFKKKTSDRSYMNSYNKDKDEEENVRPQRKQTPKDNKAKEQQPDKIEIMNRIEKEKKAIQKKKAERKNNKPARVQNRPKRTNNIDWTREYENDSYDDDDLDMYL